MLPHLQRRSAGRLCGIGAALLLAACFAFLQQGCTTPPQSTSTPASLINVATFPVPADIRRLSNEALIDRLQQESQQGPGTQATGYHAVFPPLDAPARFEGGILGSPPPARSAVVTELVSRGISTLPALLDHLSDDRSTRLVVGEGGFISACWFSDEYDSRFADESRQSGGVNTIGLHEKPFSTYTLKVGDFCFAIIGQIVHRRYAAVRYQPSGNLVVNSPLEQPNLARAIRAEWSNLPPAELEQSLLADFREFSRSDGALPRLLFYFPQAGRDTVESSLRLPLYDSSGLHSIYEDLFRADPAGRKAMLARFRTDQGETYYRYLWATIADNASEPIPHERIADNNRRVAIELLQQLFPPGRPSGIALDRLAAYDTQTKLIEELSPFDWPGLDDTILQIYLQAVAEKKSWSVGGRIGRADLALVCAKRLFRHGRTGDFAGFFSDQIAQMKRDDEIALANQASLTDGNAGYHPALSQRIEMYGNFLQELQAGTDKR